MQSMYFHYCVVQYHVQHQTFISCAYCIKVIPGQSSLPNQSAGNCNMLTQQLKKLASTDRAWPPRDSPMHETGPWPDFFKRGSTPYPRAANRYYINPESMRNAVSSPSGFQGKAPATNAFVCISSSKTCIRWWQTCFFLCNTLQFWLMWGFDQIYPTTLATGMINFGNRNRT